MANKENRTKCFLTFFAILLLFMQEVNSQGFPEISDVIVEFSYTGEQLTHLREKRSVNMDKEYIVFIEVYVSQTMFDQFKALIDSNRSLQIDNTTEITGMNVTTVCNWTGTDYECMCEDQYYWPCEKCIQYGYCNNITNSSCGCNNTLPYNGNFCQPVDELPNNSTCPAVTPPANYLIEIEIEINNVNETVLDQLRNLGYSLPLINNNVNITQINITTVCRLNGTAYQCRCEDQYFWPCEKCTLYGTCKNITNSTCGCTNALPYGGHFCQPISELSNNSTCPPGTPPELNITTTVPPTPTPADYLIEFEIDIDSITVLLLYRQYNSPELLNILRSSLPLIRSIVDITEINITTVCSWNGTEYQCSCEDQYFWPCEKCTLNGTCKNITNSTCGCTNALPYKGHFCQPINELSNSICPPVTPTVLNITTTVPPTPIPVVHVLSFSMKINEVFVDTLNDKNSAKYDQYKTIIERSIDEQYTRSVSGYKAKSAALTSFRSGSVIADFSIQATTTNLNLLSANKDLASTLRSKGLNVSDDAFSQTVKDGLYNGGSIICSGTSLVLTCNPPVNTGITWTVNGSSQGTQHLNNLTTFPLNNVSPSNSGQYACTTTVNSLPYVIWQDITVQPYPNIQVTSDKTVKCEDTSIELYCCVQDVYQVQWDTASACGTVTPASCISCNYAINKQSCQVSDQENQVKCQLTKPICNNAKSITIQVKNKQFDCSDSVFGAGNQGQTQTANCTGQTGYRVALCNSSKWQIIEDKCVLRVFAVLLEEAKVLAVESIPEFMATVSDNATSNSQTIINSPATITTIVEILDIISNLSQTILINKTVMTDFLNTADVIGSDGATGIWENLNNGKANKKVSSQLLFATERITHRLPDTSFSITTNLTYLRKAIITGPFSGTFGKNSTTQITVTGDQTAFTVIISSISNNILPVRNLTYNNNSQTNTKINADVPVVVTNTTIKNISLAFVVKNKTLENPQCVFWNFSLLNGVGGWDSTGCQVKTLGNQSDKYTCECNHTTSFSILMSPFTLDETTRIILDYITYIGVAISLASLVLCLLIEIIIWKAVTRNDTSYMRHVSIVNIAVSLLIADICFIIGAAVVEQGEGPCSTATFFMHFFYLALFFWMLLSALLLLYRILMVFSRITRGAMMAIAFTVGYGAPLLIAVITVASTAGRNGYIQRNYNCWLNWSETKALLAFVIPALTIVAINFLVLFVVLCKMIRRGVNASTQPDDKHPLLVIVRCVAILTPLFGLTWGFGIGTLVSPNRGIHIVFAFFNSLQGFFVLMFGTLLDSKVREALAGTFSLSNLSSNRTRSTSGGPSSSSGFPFFQRLRQRNGYNVASGTNVSSNSAN